MIDLQLDFSDFERKARDLKGAIDQVPFALAMALNEAAKTARTRLIDETWPTHVKVRNPRFLGWALRTEFATKASLRVEINDARAQGRGHLALHAKGGVKAARGRLAIPTARIAAARGASGVPKRLRPANLKRAVVKGNLLFIPEGRGKKAKLRLAYALRPSAKMRKDVPFVEDFTTTMRREILQRFPGAMAKAMATRR